MSGGILGGNIPQGQGILGGLNQFAQDNATALIMGGAGLMSGDWSAGGQGFAQGMAQDERTRLIRLKQAQEEQKRVAAQQWAQKNGFDPAMAAADPDGVLNLAQNLEMKKRQERAPLEIERQLTAAGITDPAERQAIIKRSLLPEPKLQEFDPDKTYARPDPSAPGGFRMVDPFGGAQAAPGAVASEQAIPPAPAGADRRTWRQEQTKRIANEGKPTEKMRTDLALAERTAATLKAELQELTAQVQQTGAEALPTEAKARLQTKFTNIQMQLKNLYELGAITGPDMELVGKILTDPTVNPINPLEWGKGFNQEGRTRVQVEELEKIIDRGLANARTTLGGGQAAGSAQQATQGLSAGTYEYIPGQGLVRR